MNLFSLILLPLAPQLFTFKFVSRNPPSERDHLAKILTSAREGKIPSSSFVLSRNSKSQKSCFQKSLIVDDEQAKLSIEALKRGEEMAMESLAQLEALCERLYNSQDHAERSRVEQTLVVFSTNVEYISQCQYILDNSSSPYAQLLASSSLVKQVSEHSLPTQLRVDISESATGSITASRDLRCTGDLQIHA